MVVVGREHEAEPVERLLRARRSRARRRGARPGADCTRASAGWPPASSATVRTPVAEAAGRVGPEPRRERERVGRPRGDRRLEQHAASLTRPRAGVSCAAPNSAATIVTSSQEPVVAARARRRARRDADVAPRRVEDVGAVAGAVHPVRLTVRLGGDVGSAPGEVLAGAPGRVAGAGPVPADPGCRRASSSVRAVGRVELVAEVARRRHRPGVPVGGVGQARGDREGAGGRGRRGRVDALRRRSASSGFRSLTVSGARGRRRASARSGKGDRDQPTTTLLLILKRSARFQGFRLPRTEAPRNASRAAGKLTSKAFVAEPIRTSWRARALPTGSVP